VRFGKEIAMSLRFWPLFRRACRPQRRKGTVVVLVALLMPFLLLLVAFALDLGFLCVVRTELQRTADAAALAGADALLDTQMRGVLDPAAGRAVAREIAALNPSTGNAPVELQDADIVIGTWDEVTRRVVPSLDPDAIEAWTHRSRDRGTGVGLFFSRIIGLDDADVSASAVAYLGRSSSAGALPIALRAPTFGPVDPRIVADNPGKDGPSYPANGESFEPGEQVTVFIYGKGPKSPVHLGLDVADANGSTQPADVSKILKGRDPPVEMNIGDEFLVIGEGTGQGGLGSALDDRLDFPTTDPIRDVILPVVETLPTSRDVRGQLSDRVRICDFVAVHLDEVIETEVDDPDKPGRTFTVRLLIGTVTRRMVSSARSSSQSRGPGGNTVVSVRLVR
jgi:Putative Flp pilus-assembly TadE/G-like